MADSSLVTEEFGRKSTKSVFPGVQGGPLMHVIAAKAVAFGEALKPEFKALCATSEEKCDST